MFARLVACGVRLQASNLSQPFFSIFMKTRLLVSRVRIHLIFIKHSMENVLLFFPVPSHAPDLLLFITLSAVRIYVPYKHNNV